MKTITVHTAKSYDVLIEKGILNQAGVYIRPLTQASRVMLITDSNVAPLYAETVCHSLERAGFTVSTLVFPAGEQSKKADTVLNMVEQMAETGLTREDLVVALGGGVTGDMAGFAAAIYQRGIAFVQIPTTLLSQIDSSVGGKTGVDLPQGKNLCGAFHQPLLVVIDPLVLDTLPDRFFNDGMAEAIKYGCISSRSLFDRLAGGAAKDCLEEMIYECVDLKRQVVEEDEKEQGRRALLNFGHTIGHAIEKCHHFEGITHGEAVGIGMVMITKISEGLGVTETGTAEAIRRALMNYHLPCKDDTVSLDAVAEAMGMDKKRTGSEIRFVMLHRLGESLLKQIPTEEIKGLLNTWEA